MYFLSLKYDILLGYEVDLVRVWVLIILFFYFVSKIVHHMTFDLYLYCSLNCHVIQSCFFQWFLNLRALYGGPNTNAT